MDKEKTYWLANVCLKSESGFGKRKRYLVSGDTEYDVLKKFKRDNYFLIQCKKVTKAQFTVYQFIFPIYF